MPPPDLTFVGLNPGMSNLDHTIDAELAELLKTQGVYAQHSAMNFCGYVWWADGAFHEEVWRYGDKVDVIDAATLEQLMAKANDTWGWA